MRLFGAEIRSFNLEITNRCTLACPECPRTGNPWVTEHLTDLPLELIERVFPVAQRERFRGLRVNLCGAHGDCIYHRDFHAVVAHLKAAGLGLTVETNGSHRKPGWWARTCELLGEDDVITFSVDGLEDTNHIYRVNARWRDIEQAMRYCAPRVAVVWKYIVFAHNEHQVEAATALAHEIGVRDVIFKKSGRFSEGDPLAPGEAYIGVVSRNRRRIRALLDAGVHGEDFDREVRILPKCTHGKDVAITARGFLYPCTSCETAEESEWFQRNREHFDLRRHGVEEILASAKWGELERSWRRASQAPAACLYYCGVHRDFDESYRGDARSDRPHKPEDAVHVTP